jgi:septum formation protein
VAAEVEELTEGDPEQVPVENARRKAAEVAGHHPEAVVLGVDTIVSVGGGIYGKPANPHQARQTLAALSGLRHTVISGVCLIEFGRARSTVVHTSVRFRRLAPALLQWYLQSGEWRERAGGYAIQGRGAALIAAIDGDYLNVVGLPLTALLELEPGLLVG